MKTIFVTLCFIAISCSHKATKEATVVTETDESTAGINSLFDLIKTKEHSPQTFSHKFNFSERYTQKEVTALGLDTATIGNNEYYFLTEEQFLTKPVTGIEFYIYLVYNYGDEWQKVLRIKDGKSARDIVLAMSGGDSDAYETATEFINDSVFIEKQTYRQALKDEQFVMAYKTDSVITKYLYDNKLNLKLISRDTITFTEEIISADNIISETRKSVNSSNFTINGIECYWNKTSIFKYNDGTKPTVANIILRLINAATGKVLLTDEDIKQGEITYIETQEENFRDINFDGHNDFVIRNSENSGSGGTYYNAYVFNPAKKMFEHSDLSGPELETDEAAKTLSSYGKSGVSWSSQQIIHFGEKGRIRYTETITREVLPDEVQDKLITTYLKYINGKVVKKKVDTTAFDGY